MLQSVDNASETEGQASRQHWLRLLARAPVERLEAVLNDFPEDRVTMLRVPETGLMMVRGRIGGSGDRFNLGEVTVTRCVLRVLGDDRSIRSGVAHVLGRSHRRAHLAALADALLQDSSWHERLQRSLLDLVQGELIAAATRKARQTQATRVDFFTLARESAA